MKNAAEYLPYRHQIFYPDHWLSYTATSFFLERLTRWLMRLKRSLFPQKMAPEDRLTTIRALRATIYLPLAAS